MLGETRVTMEFVISLAISIIGIGLAIEGFWIGHISRQNSKNIQRILDGMRQDSQRFK